MKSRISVTLDSIVLGLQAYGGISNYWGRLLQHFAALDSIESHVILPKGIQCFEYNESWNGNSTLQKEIVPTSISRYLKVHDEHLCDVFHTSYFRMPRNSSKRYVVSVYDFIYERYKKGPARWIHSWQKLRSIRRADAVICISNTTRDDVLHYIPEIDPSRVHVVYLGVDRSTFFPEPTDRYIRLKNTVLFVGQRAGYKRFDLAVAAIAQCQNLSLGIVGPNLTDLEIGQLNMQLNGRWYSLGHVSSSELRSYYSSAFALIYPSDYEGFGLPILEAMACGCPVVAAYAASLPEVGGIAAVYAREQIAELFAAALTQLYNSAVYRQTVISAGLQQVNLFSWERTFSDTLSVYYGRPMTFGNE